MKISVHLAFICFAIFAASALAAGPEVSLEPKVSLKDALVVVEWHIEREGIDTSGLYLSTAYHGYQEHIGSVWSFIWEPKEPGSGASSILLRVFDDGRVELLERSNNSFKPKPLRGSA